MPPNAKREALGLSLFISQGNISSLATKGVAYGTPPVKAANWKGPPMSHPPTFLYTATVRVLREHDHFLVVHRSHG